MHRLILFFFIFFDWLMAILSWVLLFYYRKTEIEKTSFEPTSTLYIGLIIIPLIWIFLYLIQGTYSDIKRLYRLKVFNLTFVSSIFGGIAIFFTLLLDDKINTYKDYYTLFLVFFLSHFLTTLFIRELFITFIIKKIHSGKLGFNTLLIGGSEKAVQIYNEISALPKKSGYQFIGFVNLNGIDKLLENRIPYLGHIDSIDSVLKNNKVEEIIIALESTEHERLRSIITKIKDEDICIKVLPDMYDILSGSVKLTNIFGALLMEVQHDPMPIWQRFLKRIMDFTLSLIAFIVLIPVYLGLVISVKLSSKGPIFFLQNRIGKGGKEFKIIKFRTMYVDSEKAGPQLSSSHDPRITKVGRIMRKIRLDELPQFINVIKGDMSLVGPRPERQFYIDKISEREPQFLELTRVRPGITSWGQVKYGYAENVDQMIQRMKFDLLYLKNRSLALDFKIMLYTVLIVIKAKGK